MKKVVPKKAEQELPPILLGMGFQTPVERAVQRILRSMAAELAGVIPNDRREVLGRIKNLIDDRVEAFDKSNAERLERIWRR